VLTRTAKAAWLALREAVSRPELVRVPEPSLDMSDAESVRAFDAEGTERGTLIPVYHVVAQNIHCLVPHGGQIVDLGSGSGRLLAYIARCRPDVGIIGLDLSDEMVAVGNDMLQQAGLYPRVQLRAGDMTNFAGNLPARVDLVSTVFSLHHLPGDEVLAKCMDEIARARAATGSAIWMFDYARPRQHKSAVWFPEVFTPSAAPVFRLDSTNSLIASWRYEELRVISQDRVSADMHGAVSRLMPLFQMHWIGENTCRHGKDGWVEPGIPSAHRRDAWQLAAMFPDSPAKRSIRS